MSVCACVCWRGLTDESYRTASSTGGIITAEVELLRSRLFAMSSTHLLTCTDEHMYDATVLQQSKGTPSPCLLQHDVVIDNCSTTPEVMKLQHCNSTMPQHQL